MRQIPPIPLKDKYWLDIQKEIERIFNEVLFIPLYKAVGIPVKEVRNSPSTPLEKAIAEGKVWYEDKQFKGTFNAAISKEIKEMGGKWNSKSKTWSYAATLPAGVSMAIAAASFRYEAIKKAVLVTLDDLNIASIDNLGNLPDRWTKTVQWASGDWERAIKGITVIPELTESELNSISIDYAHSTAIPIKKWAHETVLELREEVQGMVYAGQRPDAIQRLLETKYGQSRRKAKFIAHQESRLFMSAFHRSRMVSIGVKRWRWVTRDDDKVRDNPMGQDHKALHNKIFLMGEPPVVDRKTGARAYPGEPFNCRCQMIALIE